MAYDPNSDIADHPGREGHSCRNTAPQCDMLLTCKPPRSQRGSASAGGAASALVTGGRCEAVRLHVGQLDSSRVAWGRSLENFEYFLDHLLLIRSLHVRGALMALTELDASHQKPLTDAEKAVVTAQLQLLPASLSDCAFREVLDAAHDESTKARAAVRVFIRCAISGLVNIGISVASGGISTIVNGALALAKVPSVGDVGADLFLHSPATARNVAKIAHMHEILSNVATALKAIFESRQCNIELSEPNPNLAYYRRWIWRAGP